MTVRRITYAYSPRDLLSSKRQHNPTYSMLFTKPYHSARTVCQNQITAFFFIYHVFCFTYGYSPMSQRLSTTPQTDDNCSDGGLRMPIIYYLLLRSHKPRESIIYSSDAGCHQVATISSPSPHPPSTTSPFKIRNTNPTIYVLMYYFNYLCKLCIKNSTRKLVPQAACKFLGISEPYSEGRTDVLLYCRRRSRGMTSDLRVARHDLSKYGGIALHKSVHKDDFSMKNSTGNKDHLFLIGRKMISTKIVYDLSCGLARMYNNNNNLTILQRNICSLRCNFNAILAIMQALNDWPDVITPSEIWLYENEDFLMNSPFERFGYAHRSDFTDKFLLVPVSLKCFFQSFTWPDTIMLREVITYE